MALGFALPIAAGAWIDQKLGSSPIGVLAGLVLGFSVGMLQVVKLAQKGTSEGENGKSDSN